MCYPNVHCCPSASCIVAQVIISLLATGQVFNMLIPYHFELFKDWCVGSEYRILLSRIKGQTTIHNATFVAAIKKNKTFSYPVEYPKAQRQ